MSPALLTASIDEAAEITLLFSPSGALLAAARETWFEDNHN